MLLRPFRDWSIFSKIMSSSIVGICISTGVIFFQVLPIFEEKLRDEKHQALKNVVELALGHLTNYESAERAGLLTRAEAQARALQWLKTARYKNNDYFWVNDFKPRMIMHPIQPSLDGRDISEYRDPNGKKLFVEFVKSCVTNGGGFVDYVWPRAGDTRPVPKLSYVRAFPAWGWIVGSGIYIDDIAAEIAAIRLKVLVAALILAALAMVTSMLIASRISRPLQTAVRNLRRISDGDLDVAIDTSSADEPGRLLEALQHMASRVRIQLQTIRDSENYVRTLLDSLQANGIILVNEKEGTIADANEAAAGMIGCAKAELIGRPRSRFISAAPCADARDPHGAFADAESVLQKADRTTSAILTRHTRIKLDNRVYLLESFIDISEHKRMLREKESMQAQLLHASKLASIGVLSAGVAHEINNPLTIAVGNLSFLEDAVAELPQDCGQLKGFIDKQKRALDRITNIVNGLRAYARPDTTHVEDIDLEATVRETLSMIHAIYERTGVAIETEFSSKTPFIAGNTGKLQQVLMNLLSNAKDALDTRTTGRRIRIETVDQNDHVALKISDNGCGIPSDKRPLIFDPFFTTKPPGKGTGLGLSIVYSIVTAMKGDIQVESQEGTGTSFTLRFKRLDEFPRPVASEGTMPYGRPHQNVPAFALQDEAEFRAALKNQIPS